jgi:hypothetical protein
MRNAHLIKEKAHDKHESNGDRSRASRQPKGTFLRRPGIPLRDIAQRGVHRVQLRRTGEVLEIVKVISEGDVQSWYAAWKATADRVLALAEHTQDTLSKGGAYMRARPDARSRHRSIGSQAARRMLLV